MATERQYFHCNKLKQLKMSSYILYKVTTVPAGSQFVKYAKKINCSKVIYTQNKSEGKAVGLIPAVIYVILYGLSTGRCARVGERDNVNIN
jgi:hypothetical protein